MKGGPPCLKLRFALLFALDAQFRLELWVWGNNSAVTLVRCTLPLPVFRGTAVELFESGSRGREAVERQVVGVVEVALGRRTPIREFLHKLGEVPPPLLARFGSPAEIKGRCPLKVQESEPHKKRYRNLADRLHYITELNVRGNFYFYF